MQLLGYDIETVFKYCGEKFSMPTVYEIIHQTLCRIALLHAVYYVHRDIKPGNFAIGLGSESKTIYLFDFGLSKAYRNLKTKKHIEYSDNNSLLGNMMYASTNAHLGFEQSRRDDLESLGFMYVYLAKGTLPWQNLDSKDSKELAKKVMKKVITTSIETLCKDLPRINFIKY